MRSEETVSGLVEEFPSVTPDDFVTRARKVMRQERVHELPVVEDGRVEGVISQRELLNVTSTKSNVTVGGYVGPAPDLSPGADLYEASREMMRLGLDLSPVSDDRRYVGVLRLSEVFAAMEEDLSGRQVGDHMSEEVECCDASDPVSKVWLHMMDTGYTGYPVLKEGRLVGMVTASDVIREGHARVKRESRIGENARDSPPVEKVMTTPVVSVERQKGVGEVLRDMQKHDIGRLPVVNGEEVVGIVDRYDVLEAVMEEKDV